MVKKQNEIKLLRIAEFARISLTTPRALRLWQKLGLLRPYKQDRWTGYRYYCPNQVYQVMKIKWLQELGLGLREIKREDIKLSKEKKLIEELDEKIKMLQSRQVFLQRFNRFLKRKKPDLKKVKVGGWRLLIFEIKNGKYYQINQYVKHIWSIATRYPKVEFEPLEITFYKTPYFNPLKSKLKIGLIIKKGKIDKTSLPPNFKLEFYSKRKAYSYSFEGPYRFLMLVYRKLNGYFLSNKITIKSPVFEIYLKGPLNTKNEYKYFTKIYYPF